MLGNCLSAHCWWSCHLFVWTFIYHHRNVDGFFSGCCRFFRSMSHYYYYYYYILFAVWCFFLVRTKWLISFIYSFSSLCFGGTLLVGAEEMSFFHSPCILGIRIKPRGNQCYGINVCLNWLVNLNTKKRSDNLNDTYILSSGCDHISP